MHSYEQVCVEGTQKRAIYFDSGSDLRQNKASRLTMSDIVLAASFLVGPTTALASDEDNAERSSRLMLVDSQTNTDGASWKEPTVRKVSGSTYVSHYFSKSLAQSPDDWERVSDAIQRWSLLSDGWSGEQSRAPSDVALKNARRLTAMLMTRQSSPPDIYYDADGEVGFRWRTQNRVSVIAFGEYGSVEAYIDDRVRNKLREIESPDLATFPLDEFLRNAA